MSSQDSSCGVMEAIGNGAMNSSEPLRESEGNIRKGNLFVPVSQPMEESEGEASGGEGVVQEGAPTSQPSSLAYSGDNEEEYLRATWQRLGVGHDGYLSLDELATVCHAIGMEKVANEVLEQLFSRLDVDGDGRISFEEFVHMFQSGGPSGNTSFVLEESLPQQDMSGPPLSRMNSIGDDRRSMAVAESSVMSSLDPGNTGSARVEHVVEAWESLNVNNGPGLLRELGFTERGHERLSLRDLAAALEEECRVGSEREASGPVAVTALQLAAISYLHEVKFLRLSVECARGERDKLRQDLNEANQRLTLLAQELDEHSAQVEASSQLQIQELERQYREQVREVQEAAEREREAAREQVSTAATQALTQATLAHQEEAKRKAKLSSLSSDIKRLEAENMELSEKLQETERQLTQMERQVADMHTLKTKVAEYESMSPREEEYRRLVEQLERVITDNQQLRDNNDELLSQIDSLPARNTARNSDKDVSLDGSCLGDYVETGVGLEPGVGLTGVGLAGPVKRRGSNSGSGDDSCEEESPRGSKVRRCSRGLNVHYVDVGSYDESFFESSMSSLLKSSPSRSLRPLSISQPPSLEHPVLNLPHTPKHIDGEGEIRVDRTSLGVGGVSQLVNKELKQVFKQVRASMKEEYKSDMQETSHGFRDIEENRDTSEDEPNLSLKKPSRKELEAELSCLQKERDSLMKQLTCQEEEFSHQLEKKEFECEAAHGRCWGVEKQLEKFNQSPLSPTKTNLPCISTPVKASHLTPPSLKEKCIKCGATPVQLTEALEELEAALSKEEEERRQHSRTSLISTSEPFTLRQEADSTIERVGVGSSSTTSTTLPDIAVVQALSHSTRGVMTPGILPLAAAASPDDTRRRKTKGALLAEKFSRSCRTLIEKIKRKRIALTPRACEITEKQENEEERNNEHKNGEEQIVAGTSDATKDIVNKSTTENGASQNPELDFHLLEEQIIGLEEDLTHERDGLEKQRAGLMEKNGKLEQDLEILRVEFDKSEDYWSLKLQEEQDYYEEERRLYDDKFSALERKIREYEDLVLAGGGGGGATGGRDHSEDSDRLSTIDESAVWEKQVTDLEEEVALLRKQVDHLREERFNMENNLEVKVAEERNLAAQECSSLQEQVNNLSSQLRQAQLQVTAVLEEMDKVRRESEQRIQELAEQQRQSTQEGRTLVNGHMSDGEDPAAMEGQEQLYSGTRSLGEETIAGSLRSQLRQCQERLRYLEGALRQHHTHAHHILSVTREQHGAEVQNLESMIVATQQMLGQHIAKYKDQLTKASRSDSLVKELYLENAQLMRALQITESRQKSAEDTTRKLQMAALRPHTVS